MKEIKQDAPIPLKLEQFECASCEKKIYVNEEDIKELEESDELVKRLDCPFCDITSMKNTRLFETQINKFFEKD